MPEPDLPEKQDKSDGTEKPDEPEKSDEPKKLDKSEKSDEPEKPKKPDKAATLGKWFPAAAAVAFALVVVIAAFVIPAAPDQEDEEEVMTEQEEKALSGDFQDILHYEFDKDEGVLTISGSGMMQETDGFPWSEWKADIKKIVIEDGGQSICRLAFEDCENLTEAECSDSVAFIGSHAFTRSNRLQKLSVGESVAFEEDGENTPFRDEEGNDLEKLVLCGYTGSSVEEYDIEHGYAFESKGYVEGMVKTGQCGEEVSWELSLDMPLDSRDCPIISLWMPQPNGGLMTPVLRKELSAVC